MAALIALFCIVSSIVLRDVHECTRVLCVPQTGDSWDRGEVVIGAINRRAVGSWG